MHVEPREGESFDQFLRRFKTSMDKSGILREYKRKRYFKSNGELQREKAKAAAASSPRFFGGDTMLALPPYRVGLEYRTPKGIASVHKNDGEFMFVLEGEGVIVAGGTVVNPKDLGANIDGDAIAGGNDIHMKKGDIIFVPKGLPHLARTDGTFVLATLHVP